MKGIVRGRQPRIDVTMLLADGRMLAIEYVIDTGFDGHLVLPGAAVEALALTSLGSLVATTADGSARQAEVFDATVLWDGERVDVQVLAMGTRPLLGTALLNAQTLNVPFKDGVTIDVDLL